MGGTRVQRREASGGAARATGRRRQKSVGRRADHGRLTTCGQAPGGRASDREDGETARAGRGRREGGARRARLVPAVWFSASPQESPRPHRAGPAPGSAPRGSSLRTRGPAWSTPPALKSSPACNPQFLNRGRHRFPIPKGCLFAPLLCIIIAPPHDAKSSPLCP